ncbi:metallophosphoesterase [Lacinutrix sp. 5H-3-7-4]|uniref:metallophosphoesterase n=1 Tax=Lacinutrix sp. (strain 5H-3-7-4) TaxID=983544 RepID=UPI00020A3BCF|nr:metallophosphoesterase [Lacinutrix sp. 5H-3-7-4]AEH00532.1 metallophosphoesterase [Lacinutrix sp. 5H-3-7-4]
MLRWIILVLLVFAFDLYAFQTIRTLTKSYWIYVIYWLASTYVVGNFVYYYANFVRGESFTHGHGYAVAFLVTLFVPKLILVLFMFGEDIVRFVLTILNKTANSDADTVAYSTSRRGFVSKIALGLAAIPLSSFIYGIYRGKYNYQVVKHVLYFEDLPEAFDGYKITQISDVHSGSLENREKIEYGIDLINEQESDTILFTGDIVNTKAAEMNKWVDVFAKLKAKDGKYAVLGNHDYGYYAYGGDADLNAKNQRELEEIHKKIGFDLLMNDNRQIERNGQKINLLGVENWGASRHFPKRGSLKETTKTIGDNEFNILMSHDPSHFDFDKMEVNKDDINNHDIVTNETNIVNFEKHIHLTLAGHTHGMQFGIEVPSLGIKWSPVKYRYPKWAGMYEVAGKYLNVNRGFGYLAFPGRIGIWPEITVIELKKGVNNA